MLRLSLGVALILLSGISQAHSGRTNSDGCHNDRKNGGYHCHNGGTSYTPLPRKNSKEQPQALPQASLKYNRKDYPHWIDKDDDCQNERQEVLIKESLIKVKFKRNKGCTVSHGKWLDPFSGKTFTKASDLDIDHLVPLMWAHNHGGYAWTRKQRRAFANDHENLLVVWDKLNSEKGAAGPDAWLPPRKTYHCEYVKKFDEVVRKYKLVYRDAEREFIKKVESTCTK
ncbi:YHYH domain-containing protein [Pleionea sp. CnH1-48]|uniref:YHYH domain-containing protein n=1 Tax=Pleionea sp. CnH1-48 TaxID=2954494 RepID=UPI0020986596|nr:YHYH domain-containing protein [Pleionea sp. CnH1-48]MCO7227564.1 HNH endonuclease [Pleionea sp. CnH1-48]